MQRGSVEKHGRGWRGRWREGGRVRHTRTVERKGDAQRLLAREIRRMESGGLWVEPVKLADMFERFMARYTRQENTRKAARARMARPLAAWGGALADSVTTEDV